MEYNSTLPYNSPNTFNADYDMWYLGDTPVVSGWLGDTQVYPPNPQTPNPQPPTEGEEEWFDYDDTYTKYIVKDEFIGTDCLLPVSNASYGVSVSVDANGERVWRKDLTANPTITLEDKEVWVDGGSTGYSAHSFQSGETYEWIEDIVALCKKTISTGFARSVVAESFSVTRAEVKTATNTGSGDNSKQYWSNIFQDAPNYKGKFHPSWFDGYVSSCLDGTNYPHNISDLELYSTSTSGKFMAKATNLDYIPHFHSYNTTGGEAAPLGAYTKINEEVRKTSQPSEVGKYYYTGNTIMVSPSDAPAWDDVEVGDTVHMVSEGGIQHTFFRLVSRTEDALNVRFNFERNSGGTPPSSARSAFYLYKAPKEEGKPSDGLYVMEAGWNLGMHLTETPGLNQVGVTTADIDAVDTFYFSKTKSSYGAFTEDKIRAGEWFLVSDDDGKYYGEFTGETSDDGSVVMAKCKRLETSGNFILGDADFVLLGYFGQFREAGDERLFEEIITGDE